MTSSEVLRAGPFSTQRCVPRPCEHCGKEHEFWQEVWDCALFHALAGPDWAEKIKEMK